VPACSNRHACGKKANISTIYGHVRSLSERHDPIVTVTVSTWWRPVSLPAQSV
jgi:hypothetical protein